MMPAARRRARLAFPLLCGATLLAAIAPVVTAPHEANACSGGPGSPPYMEVEALPTVESATATELDLIVFERHLAIVATLGGSFGKRLASSAHLETAAGATVSTARNDFGDPSANPSRSVVRPAAPLTADTDYFLVVDGVVPAQQPDTEPTTMRVPFHTGDKLHPVPPTPRVVGEAGGRTIQPDIAVGSICCGASADYQAGGCSAPRGTPPTCATSQRLGLESIHVGWEIPADALAGHPSIGYFAEAVVTPENISKGSDSIPQLTISPVRTTDPFLLFVEAGRKVCVTVVARDKDTKEERRSEASCFDASPGIAPLRASCDDLLPLITSPKSKDGCLANAELAELLKDCPGATGAVGAGGRSGSSVCGLPGAPSCPPTGLRPDPPASAPAPSSSDGGGCAFGDVARSDRTAALSPLLAAVAAIWIARRRGR